MRSVGCSVLRSLAGTQQAVHARVVSGQRGWDPAPTSSSSRAAAIQPGACLGLVLVTLFSSSLAFLMSEISASDDILIDFMSVR